MPSTLVHVALQGLLTRAVARDGSWFSWALLGILVPDIPWILQRAVDAASLAPDPYALRAYVTVQASLAFSLLAAGAAVLLLGASWRAWLVTTGGCALHLALDSLEIKWGNGVHFLAPIDWEQVNAGLIWPDHWLSWLLSAAGLAVFAAVVARDGLPALRLTTSGAHIAAAVFALLLYGLLPVALLEGPYASDSHYLQTLADRDGRPGRYVELDRSRVDTVAGETSVTTYAGESIALRHDAVMPAGTWSLRGRFADDGRLVVDAAHRHDGFRDAQVMVGLLLIAAWFVTGLWRGYRPAPGVT